MGTKLHVIRHGITRGNRDRLFYGAADYPLVQEGYDELNSLKKEGVYPDLDEDTSFFVSGMIRCEQTLRTLYGERTFTVIPLLKEMDCGEFEGLTFEEVNAIPAFNKWIRDNDPEIPIPGGESYNIFYERTNRGFDQLLSVHETFGKDSFAVLHGGVISSVMSRWFGNGVGEGFWTWLPKPGRGYTLTIEDGKPVSYRKI